MTSEVIISVAEDFTVAPGGRFRADGVCSGEELREDFLRPHIKAGRQIAVELDGAHGYAMSFLDEAFGVLARRYGADYVLSLITFVSDENPSLIDDITECIKQVDT